MTKSEVVKTVNFGLIGVIVFFVLSSYLITRILLFEKNTIKSKISHILKRFYINRAIRIFPIYYLAIILLLLINYQGIREHYSWFITYLQNFLFYLRPTESYDYVIHFWSLAVEEQFYLLWPLLILSVNSKHIPAICVFLIISAPLFRLQMYNSGVGSSNYLLMGSIDAFAWGGLLAYFQSKQKYIFSNNYFTMVVSVLIFIINLLFFQFYFFDFYFSVSLFSVSIISIINKNQQSGLSLLLNNSFLQFIGTVSYSIYIFHYFIYPLNHWAHILSINWGLKIGTISIVIPEFNNQIVRFLWYFFITLSIASISWYFIEKQLLKLKTKWPQNSL